MTGGQLKTLRERLGWTQVQAANRTGVSQPYWSLIERNRRPVPERVVRSLAGHVELSPTALPVGACASLVDSKSVALALGALGYPGFAYLRRAARPVNPACLLFEALRQESLEPRMAAALPWVLLRYPDLDWNWLLDQAKRHNLQNRLGFLVALARRVAERQGSPTTANLLSERTHALDEARLVREDTFGRRLTEAERRYLREQRPEDARYWNMLTNLRPDHLQYVA